MDIDITDNKAKEIMEIIQNYPYGHLEIKFERVFWHTEMTTPYQSPVVDGSHPHGHQPTAIPNKQKGFNFEHAGNALMNMVCGAPRQQPPPQKRQ